MPERRRRRSSRRCRPPSGASSASRSSRFRDASGAIIGVAEIGPAESVRSTASCTSAALPHCDARCTAPRRVPQLLRTVPSSISWLRSQGCEMDPRSASVTRQRDAPSASGRSSATASMRTARWRAASASALAIRIRVLMKPLTGRPMSRLSFALVARDRSRMNDNFSDTQLVRKRVVADARRRGGRAAQARRPRPARRSSRRAATRSTPRSPPRSPSASSSHG